MDGAPAGEWLALERSVVGLAALGKKEDAAALRPLTEELVRTGVWVSSAMSPFRTAAGIAAACAGDWAAAKEHHLTAIHQMDTAPYRHAQPIARMVRADAARPQCPRRSCESARPAKRGAGNVRGDGNALPREAPAAGSSGGVGVELAV